MYLIDKIRNERTRVEMESVIESGNIKIKLESTKVDINQRDMQSMRLTYGDLIELYKMLQNLYREDNRNEKTNIK